ncbi:MAG: hypothetical protein K2P31_02455, partial [Rickettsiaceae bacterium]|nr:hypothetical protein [Rickettsiaceae bacterium]
NDAIKDACSNGLKVSSTANVSHITKDTIVVTGKNRQVITVMENAGNTKYYVTRSTKNREQELLKKVKQGNDSAMCDLAELYLSGDLGISDAPRAYNLLLQATRSRRPNSHAMYMLAEMHEEGNLGEPKHEQAIFWWKESAKHRNKYALYVVAQHLLIQYLTFNGNLISNTSNQLLQSQIEGYLNMAVSKGGVLATWLQGYIFEKGYFGIVDLAKATKLYTTAAKSGNIISIKCLQHLSLNGFITNKEFEKLLDEISEDIGLTNSGAAVGFGLEQLYGLIGNDIQRGFRLIKRAAENDNIKAMYALVECCRRGLGCNIDLQLAKVWGEKVVNLSLNAGTQGNVRALWDLGHAHLSGILGEIDLVLAEKIFTDIASNNDPFYKFALGMLYIEGVLDDNCGMRGKEWILKALEQWSERATAGDVKSNAILQKIYANEDLWFEDNKLSPINTPTDKINLQTVDNLAVQELRRMLKRTKKPSKIRDTRQWPCCEVYESNKIFEIETTLSPEKIYHKAMEIKNGTPLLAAHYFRTSAKCGYIKAYFELAELFASGKLGQNVKQVSILFYKRAAKRGHYDDIDTLLRQRIESNFNIDPVAVARLRCRANSF